MTIFSPLMHKSWNHIFARVKGSLKYLFKNKYYLPQKGWIHSPGSCSHGNNTSEVKSTLLSLMKLLTVSVA